VRVQGERKSTHATGWSGLLAFDVVAMSVRAAAQERDGLTLLGRADHLNDLDDWCGQGHVKYQPTARGEPLLVTFRLMPGTTTP
jgi:hypothetical protein